MTLETVTLRLPNNIYQRVKQRAQVMHRSVEDELLAVVAASLPDEEELPDQLAAELNQLSLFTDDELWQAARATLPANKRERMAELSQRAKEQDLTEGEQQEVEDLLYLYDRNMLLRAKAAVLLQERGHDISILRIDPRTLPH
jgi:plasmid stability protein